MVFGGALELISESPGEPEVALVSKDGEEFSISVSVAKLIGAVASKLPSKGQEPIPVDIDDCLILDQILRFLETQVARSADNTHLELDLLHLKKYQDAAARLKIPVLLEYCARIAGRLRTTRLIRWSEVMQHQKADDLWLLIDGRVYDCTEWLPMHPGGKALLLGLGKDASYLFEMYHASNESYRYLNNFFIGTLDPQDIALVPPCSTTPSDAFLSTLRSFLA